ncbi:FtsX-like permease family protein [Actinokineospora inagensis]|uniref:FtsX-like permease family protein n=1 Tax=Actinokineospora inagensis TaxID=103730 RepID=UPI0004116728|nr:FtsX-like permease family protein [Actinokineospora inagensis]
MRRAGSLWDWLNDMGIGVRLAVGGGRTSLVRFVLSALGVGLAVAVLLLAASVGPIVEARSGRDLTGVGDTRPIAGVAPTIFYTNRSEFRERQLDLLYLRGTAADSPAPKGIPGVPGPGEMYVSAEMADLLTDPLLRARFPERVVGTIAPETVRDPHDAVAYLGSGDLDRAATPEVGLAYRFGLDPVPYSGLRPNLLLLLLLGIIAVLIPVFIFLVSATRIAGAERDRRLSALRLVGADSRQVRRIAAAESLVGAVFGVLVGIGVFLVGRQVAGGVTLYGASVYTADIVPVWWLAGLVVLSAPVLAVFAAQFALRRTIIEPLGMVRRGTPTGRRLAWRLVAVLAGIGVLAWLGRSKQYTTVSAGQAVAVAIAVCLVLIGVPVLLPWVVERVVRRLRGGSASWQLAVRRLQLDSGTSARVVSGVAVVLAGAIALQTALLSQASSYSLPRTGYDSTPPASWHNTAEVYVAQQGAAGIDRLLAGAPAVQFWSRIRYVDLRSSSGDGLTALVTDCAMAERMSAVDSCVDGRMYANPDVPLSGFSPGASVSAVLYDVRGGYGPGSGTPESRSWTLARPIERGMNPLNAGAVLLITPGALPALPPASLNQYGVLLDPADPDSIDRLRVALGPLTWRAFVPTYSLWKPVTTEDENQRTFLTIRRGLLVGALLTLMLAGISLLVLAVEHIRERRRPLAVLAASGVPTGVIARSLLWQIVVPIVLGVAVAVALGGILAVLVVRLMRVDLVVDWLGAAAMTGAAGGLVVLVSLLTLPFLRSATRLESLRTE